MPISDAAILKDDAALKELAALKEACGSRHDEFLFGGNGNDWSVIMEVLLWK